MITSARNPRLIRLRKLSQRKHRQRQNLFMVEGLQLLGMAVDIISAPSPSCSRINPQEVFYSEPLFTGRTAPRLLTALVDAGAEPVAVAPGVLNALSERDASQGLAVTFVLSDLECAPDQLVSVLPTAPVQQAAAVRHQSAGLVLILDRLQDPGNMGTIFRTADAVGAVALFLLEPCVDPFDPKTVRSTMGSLFTVPFARIDRVAELLPQLEKLGYTLVGADVERGPVVWQTDALHGSLALILGNEARGLSPELNEAATAFIKLPQHGLAKSLNVAVAGAVLMYEWLRVNSVERGA